MKFRRLTYYKGKPVFQIFFIDAQGCPITPILRCTLKTIPAKLRDQLKEFKFMCNDKGG